jgi:hypothetical protein
LHRLCIVADGGSDSSGTPSTGRILRDGSARSVPKNYRPPARTIRIFRK